jgi:TolB-like protein
VALRTLAAATSAPLPKSEPETASIAVLPFANLSPDPEQEYFSDGLTEEIITDLSKIGSLRVTSRTSAWVFKGTDQSIPNVASELGVRYVLEGSVRRAGDRLRITAQLIDATSDDHVWAEKYAGTVEDVFDIQENVSRAIVEELKVRLTPDEEDRIRDRQLEDVHAYECYLKAKNQLFVNTRESLERALQYLENGLRISGENALLLAGIGYVHFQKLNWGFAHEDSAEKAESYATRALRLNPDSAEAHLVLGLITLMVHGDQRRAIAFVRRSLEIDPNNYEALFWLIHFLSVVGSFSAVEPLIERLQHIDPLNPRTLGAMAFFEMFSGQFDAAIEHSRIALEQEPDSIFFHDAHAWSLAYGGRHQDFRALVKNSNLEASDNSLRRIVLSARCALDGDREGFHDLIDEDVETTARRDLQFSQNIGAYLAQLGEHDLALDWLENAFNRGFYNYPFLAEHDPFLKSLRGKPAFQDLLRRVKKAWELFEV